MTNIILPLSFLRPAALGIAFTICLGCPQLGFAAKAPDSDARATVATARPRAIPESVFDYRAGKDPFFPNRVVTPVPVPEPAKREIMVLKGITGTPDRRLALINDRTFTKGEVGEIKSGTNEFKIRVIDIKDRSVTIERAGQTNELPLVENLLPLDGRK
jgi:hypothetical protein